MNKFVLKSNYQPKGDQPSAIKKLIKNQKKHNEQVLLGVTGSGKTFTIANVIEKINKPTLIISHNKTLAVQLYNEFKTYFPENKVCFFVSYYDYYQPESYLPVKDLYIEKETQINEKIEQYRLETAVSLLTRQDVIVVASVSCIYGFGNPNNFKGKILELKKGTKITRRDFLQKLIDLQYQRNDIDLRAGKFRVLGDTVDLIPGYGKEILKIEFFGDEIEKITLKLLSFKKEKKEILDKVNIFPVRPFVVAEENYEKAINSIELELKDRIKTLSTGEPEQELLAHRIKQRTNFDLEMIKELGTCKGIENYSRHFDGRMAGEPPHCLMDFFPKDFLLVIDESHVTLPQVGGMYAGDRSRKMNLIDYGFRLPSAADNRPLKIEEFRKYLKNVIYMSATPGEYEKEKKLIVTEQLIRPTGLLDPLIEVRKKEGQIEDLLDEIKKTINKKNRVLVTTLTKKQAEDLADFLAKEGIKVRYLHSEIDTLERTEILRDLRLGKFDCLVGINLLREGLDLPEVELVTILDADKEGFLRNYRSLVQTIGRVARNIDGRVILYANKITVSMKKAIDETTRRREIQEKYNIKNNITPQGINKKIEAQLTIDKKDEIPEKFKDISNKKLLMLALESEMLEASGNLDFEKAIELRDIINKL